MLKRKSGGISKGHRSQLETKLTGKFGTWSRKCIMIVLDCNPNNKINTDDSLYMSIKSWIHKWEEMTIISITISISKMCKNGKI